jgi:myosin-5
MVEKAYSLRLDFCNLQDIQRYELSDPRSFHYLNQSSCIEVDRINDAEEYLATRRVMDIVGINEEEQVSLLIF